MSRAMTFEPRLASRAMSLEQLYAEHAPQVLRWAARLGGTSVDAEDITHDVFLKASELLPALPADANVLGWLYTLTRNAAINRRRRERLRTFWRRLFGREAATPAPQPLPHEPLERAQERIAVHAALDRLGSRHREVLVLFELEGLSGREVAELMQVRESAVWVLLHRARAALARELSSPEVTP